MSFNLYSIMESLSKPVEHFIKDVASRRFYTKCFNLALLLICAYFTTSSTIIGKLIPYEKEQKMALAKYEAIIKSTVEGTSIKCNPKNIGYVECKMYQYQNKTSEAIFTSLEIFRDITLQLSIVLLALGALSYLGHPYIHEPKYTSD